MICYTKRLGFLVLILLISGTAQAVKVWQPLGPSPIYGGQSEIDVNNPQKRSPQVGAVNAIAPHPTNPNILYVATVAGGIWKTENAKDAEPKWLPISDLDADGFPQESLSTSDISFDPDDSTDHSTLVASYGRYSSYARRGGLRMGVIHSTDHGATWTKISTTFNSTTGVTMEGKNINSVKVFRNVVLTSVDAADINSCDQLGIFGSYGSVDAQGNSIATGQNWFQMGASLGLIQGRAYALEADPFIFGTYYVGIDKIDCGGAQSGIYKTSNFGQSWTLINNGTMSALVNSASCAANNQYLIGIGQQNNVYVGVLCEARLAGVFRSGDGGSNWTGVDLPGTTENSGFQGLHPGGQGFIHRSMVADPIDVNIVYVGGDRQPDALELNGSGQQFPNSIGAMTYSGRLFRGDASLPVGSQWSPLTHSGTASNTAPHADSRDLAFDVDGALIEVDDGGVYRMLAPRTTSSDWISANGNIQNSEIHSSDYDSNTHTSIAGLQDNGTGSQAFLAEKKWNSVLGGDGGDVAVDAISLAAQNQSIRYTSFQFLGGFNRQVFNQDNQSLSRIFFNPVVVSGAAFIPKFLTPIALNGNNPLRMVFGGENSVYESFDQGDTISEVGAGIIVSTRIGTKNIAYGNNFDDDILYVGGFVPGVSNGVYVRTTAGGPLVFKYAASTGDVNGVVVNDNVASEAFLVENARIMRTVDSGNNWTDITGDFATAHEGIAVGEIRTIEFIDGFSFDALIVGTDKRTFWTTSNVGYTDWERFGALIPPVPIYSLEYNKEADVLVAGTMGRGQYIVKAPLSSNDVPEVNPFDLTMNLLKGSTSSSLTNGTISLLENFTGSSGQTLTVQTTPVQQPSNGLVTLNSDGSFIYQHDDSMTNADEFYYRVCDFSTPALCNDAKVNITIDFGTDTLSCSSPNVDIPDNDAIIGVTDTLTMTQSDLITDLEVALEINHTWVGDLTVKLVHVATGTEVILIDRPGLPAISNGCNADNISTILDDAELLLVEDQCAVPMAINGRFKPNGTLSSFNNLQLAGNWSLNVTDSAGSDQGALISWCLNPKSIDLFKDGFE
jgi:subtilisin-like proprotein convertase family protein